MTNTADIDRASADIHRGLQRGEHFPCAWLANTLARFGARIDAGQAIMSGSLTLPTALRVGDRVATQFTPLGGVVVQVV